MASNFSTVRIIELFSRDLRNQFDRLDRNKSLIFKRHGYHKRPQAGGSGLLVDKQRLLFRSGSAIAGGKPQHLD